MLTCSTERPWGIHAEVRSDEECPRCGWTAPGQIGDSMAEARAAADEARARAAALGWTLHGRPGGEALAT